MLNVLSADNDDITTDSGQTGTGKTECTKTFTQAKQQKDQVISPYIGLIDLEDYLSETDWNSQTTEKSSNYPTIDFIVE